MVEDRIKKVRDLMDRRGYDGLVVRDNASLRWLTGAQSVFDSEQAHTAFITADKTFLHTDSRYANTFIERLGTDGPWQIDQDALSHAKWIVEKASKEKARIIGVEDTMAIGLYRTIERAAEDSAIHLGLTLTHGDIPHLRAVKDEEELKILRKAQSITDAAFSYILTVIEPGMTEMSLKSKLEGFMFDNGADALAFTSIVASGSNSANPHAIPGQRKVEVGDLLLFDYGAGFADYCSDMTRTVVIGEPASWQREIYDVVLNAHTRCKAMIAPGISGAEVHAKAEEIIKAAGYGEYFQHGLGHGVGIDIHEQPVLGKPGRATKELEVGNVVTVEPGIYLPGKGGVRIEDCGVITEEGYQSFTESTTELQIL